MGQITSLFVHKVIAQAHDSLNRRGLLESVGVDPNAPIDPKVMVDSIAYYDLFERVARADPNGIDLPLRVGASMRCADYGAFGLAWKSALNLKGSCERAERYARVLTSVATYEVRDAPEGILMLLHRDGDRRLGLRLSNEATIASIAAISQEVSTRQFRAEAIHFKHAAPASILAHEMHFGCPVHFGTEIDALRVSREIADTPNRLGDASIVRFFDAHLDEELAEFDDGDASLPRRVRSQVAQSLSEGIPAVSVIAGRFGISGRSLQRRLAERGHTYQAIVDDARRELAERLLRETEYSLAEIAFLTGFSEQSAFNRAFRRWAGQTPRSFRIAAKTDVP